MSHPSLLPFRAPASAAPAAPPAATVGNVLTAYLAHLGLKLQLGQLSPDHHANVARNLGRFGDAWRVVAGDGRQVMVQAERAASQDGAIAQGMTLLGRAGALEATRNRDWPLAQASSDDLTRWVLANPQWKTGWTKTNNLTAVVAAFRWYEDETGVRAPYRRGRIPQFERESRREADAGEYVRLMKHTSSNALRQILWCLWNLQGCRTCEARELQWSDFQWDAGCIVLKRHKTRRKTGKAKIIGLTPRQLRFFRGLERAKLPGTMHVFLNTEGGPWTRRALAQHLRRTAKRIGLDDGVDARISAYCLRHSFATQCGEADVDDAKTALLMGHTSPEMVRRVYSKLPKKVEPLRKAAIAVETARRQARRAKRKPKAQPPRADQPTLFE